VGAFLLISIPEIFRVLADYRMIFYGLILILTMLFRREGIFRHRIYSLKISTPWEKKEKVPQYLVRDKFLPDDPLAKSNDGFPKS
jgi:hypothetical protein